MKNCQIVCLFFFFAQIGAGVWIVEFRSTREQIRTRD